MCRSPPSNGLKKSSVYKIFPVKYAYFLRKCVYLRCNPKGDSLHLTESAFRLIHLCELGHFTVIIGLRWKYAFLGLYIRVLLGTCEIRSSGAIIPLSIINGSPRPTRKMRQDDGLAFCLKTFKTNHITSATGPEAHKHSLQ